MMIVFAIFLCAILNRVRGGGFGGDLLPSRALFWVTPAIGLLALIFVPPLVAGALAVAYFFWGLWPWGHLQVLSRMTVEQIGRVPSNLEKTLLRWARGDASLALLFRHLMILPGLILAVWAGAPFVLMLTGVIFAVLTVSAYELAWRLRPSNPIWVAEMATGALWGALIAF